MEIPTNVPSYYKSLSLRLWRVLENIGVSEDIRKVRMEVATTREILATLKARVAYNPKTRLNIFGSYSEGTTTFGCYFFEYNRTTRNNLGLLSDIDFLISFEDLNVIQELDEAPSDKTTFLLVADENTKPGYCKLQLVKNGVPRTASSKVGTEFTYAPNTPRVDRQITYKDLDVRRTESSGAMRLTYIEDEVFDGDRLYEDYNGLLTWRIDEKDRVVVVNRPQLNQKAVQLDRTGMHQVHGPAYSSKGAFGWLATDMVYAYQCKRWLLSNTSWLKKSRKYNWPSPNLIKEMEQLGFFVVPVGHPNSSEQEYEWRISFSLQERQLVQSFNPTQYACFVILKFLKKDVLFHIVKEESLTSYHLKTCMFHMIENTPGDLWQPGNLLACLEGCLVCLINWTRDGVCPNYFIPEENMFERKIFGPLKVRLLEALENLLSSKCMFLLQIGRDDIGQQLHELCYSRNPKLSRTDYKARAIGTLFLDECRDIMDVRNELLYRFKRQQTGSCCESLFQGISDLRKIETVTEHTKEETQKAISMLLSYLEISLMSNLVARQMEKSSPKADIQKVVLSQKWNDVAAVSDCFSAKLKQATLLHALKCHHESLDILYALEKECSPYTTALCSCRDKIKMLPVQVPYRIQQENLSIESLRRGSWAPCSVFFFSERKLVPTPLEYEIFRSYDMRHPASKYEELKNEYYWYDNAVVDNKFYLYFLLYLNHKEIAKPSEAAIDIDSMELLIGIDPSLRHLETALNLLAWVHKQEGMKEKAVRGFRVSLSLQKVHNAAVKHLKEID